MVNIAFIFVWSLLINKYNKMKLTETAIKHLRLNKRTRAKLVLALDKSEATILRYIYSNDENLTKAAAIEVIRKETGLKDSEILEKSEIAA